jgi:inosose dehydratase
VSPIGWVNDDLPSLGAGTPLATILDDAAAIGFAGIERGGVSRPSRRRWRTVLQGAGLALAGAWHGSGLLAHGLAGNARRSRRRRRCSTPVAAGCSCWPRPAARSTAGAKWRCAAAAPGAQRMARVWRDADAWGAAGRAGPAPGLSLSPGHVVEDADDLARLIDATGESVGLVIDTGHARLGGIDPVALIRDHPRAWRMFMPRTCGRTWRRRRSGRAPRSWMACWPDVYRAGRWRDRFCAGLRGAARDRYAGWIVIEAEQDPALAPLPPMPAPGWRI